MINLIRCNSIVIISMTGIIIKSIKIFQRISNHITTAIKLILINLIS
jgi:hypothetical protein